MEGSGSRVELETLGVIVSKFSTARAIQLPNRSHKQVAGVIDVQALLSLLALSASDSDSIELSPVAGTAPFASVVPDVILRSKGENVEKHLEYILHSTRKEESSHRAHLSWTSSVVGGVETSSDVADLARYK